MSLRQFRLFPHTRSTCNKHLFLIGLKSLVFSVLRYDIVVYLMVVLRFFEISLCICFRLMSFWKYFFVIFRLLFYIQNIICLCLFMCLHRTSVIVYLVCSVFYRLRLNIFLADHLLFPGKLDTPSLKGVCNISIAGVINYELHRQSINC